MLLFLHFGFRAMSVITARVDGNESQDDISSRLKIVRWGAVVGRSLAKRGYGDGDGGCENRNSPPRTSAKLP